ITKSPSFHWQRLSRFSSSANPSKEHACGWVCALGISSVCLARLNGRHASVRDGERRCPGNEGSDGEHDTICRDVYRRGCCRVTSTAAQDNKSSPSTQPRATWSAGVVRVEVTPREPIFLKAYGSPAKTSKG